MNERIRQIMSERKRGDNRITARPVWLVQTRRNGQWETAWNGTHITNAAAVEHEQGLHDRGEVVRIYVSCGSAEFGELMDLLCEACGLGRDF